MEKNVVLFDEEVYGKGAKRKVPEKDELAEHIVRKAKACTNCKDEMEERLKENEQYELLKNWKCRLHLF